MSYYYPLGAAENSGGNGYFGAEDVREGLKTLGWNKKGVAIGFASALVAITLAGAVLSYFICPDVHSWVNHSVTSQTTVGKGLLMFGLPTATGVALIGIGMAYKLNKDNSFEKKYEKVTDPEDVDAVEKKTSGFSKRAKNTGKVALIAFGIIATLTLATYLSFHFSPTVQKAMNHKISYGQCALYMSLSPLVVGAFMNIDLYAYYKHKKNKEDQEANNNYCQRILNQNDNRVDRKNGNRG